jgi:hypothetical protein
MLLRLDMPYMYHSQHLSAVFVRCLLRIRKKNRKRSKIFLLFFLWSAYTCAQDFSKGYIPLDLDQTCLIVEKIDSAGKKCRHGKEWVYCNSFDKTTDKKLTSLQQEQEYIFKKYKLDYIIVMPEAFPYQEYTEFKEVHKFRYILKMHTFIPVGGKESEICWIYYFHDRKTGKNYLRIPNTSGGRLSSLKELVNTINAKFNK